MSRLVRPAAVLLCCVATAEMLWAADAIELAELKQGARLSFRSFVADASVAKNLPARRPSNVRADAVIPGPSLSIDELANNFVISSMLPKQLPTRLPAQPKILSEAAKAAVAVEAPAGMGITLYPGAVTTKGHSPVNEPSTPDSFFEEHSLQMVESSAELSESEIQASATLNDLVEPPSLIPELPSNHPDAATPYSAQDDAARVLAALQTQTTPMLALNIDLTGAVAVEPQKLTFAQTDDKVGVVITNESTATAQLNVFVRDNSILEWSAKDQNLIARKEGKTEVYVQYDNQMRIIPVEVGPGLPSENLETPQLLTAIDRTGTAATPKTASMPGLTGHESWALPGNQPEKSKQTVEEAVQSVERTRRAETETTLVVDDRSVGFTSVDIQVLDDRSDLHSKTLYPAVDVSVAILGTDYIESTDSSGLVRQVNIPNNSRVLVAISDKNGAYAPTIREVAADSSADGVIQVKIMRSFIREALAQMVGRAQDADQASMCGTVVDNGEPVAGVNISVVNSETQPYYFNDFGFIDLRQAHTSADGRFCFFGVDPSPLFLQFIRDGAITAGLPAVITAGNHLEQDFEIAKMDRIVTQLVAVKTSQELLHDSDKANPYRVTDMVDLINLGEHDEFTESEDRGIAVAPTEVSLAGNSAYYVASASEIEPALYRFTERPGTDSVPVTPLFHRGFVEDLAASAEIVPREGSGSVLVEHGLMRGQGAVGQTVDVALVNAEGQEMHEKVAFGAGGSGMLFTNLDSGIYTILVKSQDSFWLAADTVTVYGDTTSYVRTGSQIRAVKPSSLAEGTGNPTATQHSLPEAF